VGRELHGKVLGVVGMGRSGRQLATAAEALGMRVLGVTSRSPTEDFHALLAEADVVSLHCPLTSRTEHLFDATAFARMKRGALLVNCARGGLIDRSALEAALAAGTLGGVGLDVYWEEPWDPADPLFAKGDVLTLPHVASCTDESFDRTVAVVIENLERLLRGDPLLHRIA